MVIKNLFKTIIGINNIKHIKSWIPSAKQKVILDQPRIFYSQFLKQDNLLFDIGANYDNRIEPLINQGIKIIAVEPQKECVQYLKKNKEKKLLSFRKGWMKKLKRN